MSSCSILPVGGRITQSLLPALPSCVQCFAWPHFLSLSFIIFPLHSLCPFAFTFPAFPFTASPLIWIIFHSIICKVGKLVL